MSHTVDDKNRLLKRVARIKGQVSGIEKMLQDEKECSSILQTIAACKGAINGLMTEVLEGHVRHVMDREKSAAKQKEGASEVLELLRSYLKY